MADGTETIWYFTEAQSKYILFSKRGLRKGKKGTSMAKQQGIRDCWVPEDILQIVEDF